MSFFCACDCLAPPPPCFYIPLVILFLLCPLSSHHSLRFEHPCEQDIDIRFLKVLYLVQLEAQSYPSIAMTLHTALIVVVPKFCDANDWWWSGFMTNIRLKVMPDVDDGMCSREWE